jgi:AraC-like DNA-binding protein
MPSIIDDIPEFVPKIDYFVHRKCSPSWRIGENYLPFWDITYVTKGRAFYEIDGKKYILEAGDILCLPPGHIRKASPDVHNLMHCFAVIFAMKNTDGTTANKLPLPLINHIGERKDLVHLFNEISFCWLDRQRGYQIKVRGLLTLVLHKLFELIVYNIDSTAGDSRVKKVIRYISIHYPQQIEVKKMAAMTGLNPMYFGQLFKRETGMTMDKYLIRTRIRNAENMLRSGEYKVMEAAEECGYCDVYYFYKQFKALLGFAPSLCIPKNSPCGLLPKMF